MKITSQNSYIYIVATRSRMSLGYLVTDETGVTSVIGSHWAVTKKPPAIVQMACR